MIQNHGWVVGVALSALGCGSIAGELRVVTADEVGCRLADAVVYNGYRQSSLLKWSASCGDKFFACTAAERAAVCEAVPAADVTPESRAEEAVAARKQRGVQP